MLPSGHTSIEQPPTTTIGVRVYGPDDQCVAARALHASSTPGASAPEPHAPIAPSGTAADGPYASQSMAAPLPHRIEQPILTCNTCYHILP